MKRSIGVGGTLVDGVLEIQGPHADKALEILKKNGYVKAKKIAKWLIFYLVVSYEFKWAHTFTMRTIKKTDSLYRHLVMSSRILGSAGGCHCRSQSALEPVSLVAAWHVHRRDLHLFPWLPLPSCRCGERMHDKWTDQSTSSRWLTRHGRDRQRHGKRRKCVVNAW